MVVIAAMTFSAIWSCSGGGGVRKVVLRAADNQELTYPTTQGLVKMGELLSEWTGGRITVQVYHSGQLGAEKETIEQTQFGAIDINRVNVIPLTQVEPGFNLFALPYVFASKQHMWRVLEGDIGRQLLDRLARHNLIGLGYYDSGARSFYTVGKVVRTFGALKGLKLRVQKAEVAMAMVRALGASPSPMAFEEVYTSLQTGVIDGAENNVPSYVSKGHYEVAKSYCRDEHSRAPEVIVMSKRTWDRLSAEDRELVRRAALESVAYQRALWDSMENEATKKAQEAGCAFVEIEDKSPFVKAMEPLYAKYAAEFENELGRIRALQ
jgi:tripartite ATP-independent transporter DctP family solute receptor